MSTSHSENSSSSGYDTPHSHADDDEVTQAEDGEIPQADGAAGALITYIPLEQKYKAKFTFEDEPRIRHSYDIPSSVQLYFKDSANDAFDGGDVCLYEKMFMAGLRLSFSPLARELLQYLHMGSSQIRPNGWRYFFSSYLQWAIVLGDRRMSINQFFSIY